MSKDQVAGTAKRVVGKEKEQGGKIIGDHHQQQKEGKHQADGKSREAVEDAEVSTQNRKHKK